VAAAVELSSELVKLAGIRGFITDDTPPGKPGLLEGHGFR
jgi:hypothetical protein